MSDTKHTPGPWSLMEVGDYSDFRGRSQIIMSEDDLSGENTYRLAAVHVSDEEGAANALLMNSSPQLFKALEMCRPYVAYAFDQGIQGAEEAGLFLDEVIALATARA